LLQQSCEFRGHVSDPGVDDPRPGDGDDPESLSHGSIGKVPAAQDRGGSRSRLDLTAERLTKQTLGAITGDGLADLAAGHDGPGKIVTREKIKHKEASNLLDAFLVH
jgi:hypothetical protein